MTRPISYVLQIEVESCHKENILGHIKLAGSESSRANHSPEQTGHLINRHISAGLVDFV